MEHQRHNGTITNVHSGLCLDVKSSGVENSTPVLLWTCNNSTIQRWSKR